MAQSSIRSPQVSPNPRTRHPPAQGPIRGTLRPTSRKSFCTCRAGLTGVSRPCPHHSLPISLRNRGQVTRGKQLRLFPLHSAHFFYLFFLKINAIRSSLSLLIFWEKSLFCVFVRHLDIPSQTNLTTSSSSRFLRLLSVPRSPLLPIPLCGALAEVFRQSRHIPQSLQGASSATQASAD